jgi:uncharacterized protein (TIGR02646 family)
MIKVVKTEANNPAWVKLQLKAAAARAKAIKDFEDTGDVKIDRELYAEFKPYLQKLFNGKCAYCEAEIASNQPGDLEHFRPKGRVVDDNFKPIKAKYPKKGEMDHAGYFWLAYWWCNLLPSCRDCNSYRHHGGPFADDGAGKADRFPVDGFRACLPDEEAAEKPLLINPTDDLPEDHLEFSSDGKIGSKSTIGEQTLRLLGLNIRESLVRQRRLAYRHSYSVFKDWLVARATDNEADENDKLQELREILRAEQPHTAMQRLAVETFRAKLAAKSPPIIITDL